MRPEAAPRLALAPLFVLLALLIAIAHAGPRPIAWAQDEPPPEGEASPEAPPTRTRRPTRTPRATATPTATPLPAAALRLTLGSEPPVPEVGEVVDVVFTLENRDANPALDLTLEASAPGVLIADQVLADAGELLESGDLARWYLPRLDPGARATLRFRGVSARATSPLLPSTYCALLLSRGAPLEHCAQLAVLTARGAAVPDGDSEGDPGGDPEDAAAVAGPTALPAAPTGVGLEDLARAPRELFGWLLLAVGAGAIGAWLGVLLRDRSGAA